LNFCSLAAASTSISGFNKLPLASIVSNKLSNRRSAWSTSSHRPRRMIRGNDIFQLGERKQHFLYRIDSAHRHLPQS
jgi:hypothetical protein